MAVTPTIYAASIVWNSITWNKSAAGGPLNVRYMHEGNEQAVFTGDDEYAQTIFVVDKTLRAFVSLSDVKQLSAPGTSSNMVITLTTSGGTSVLTLVDMVFLGVNGNQPRGIPGEAELAFVSQSADGTTVPIS
jgi:hypothetical protein